MATRTTIIDAAIKSFAQLGYEGASYRDITDRCGAKRSLILYHFNSKDELWIESVTEVERRFSDAFDAVFSPHEADNDLARVRHALSAYIDALASVPEYGQIYLKEGASEGPRMEWLATHFVPRRAMNVALKDSALRQRIQTTVLRDMLASVLVGFMTLSPLMERSLAVAIRKQEAGIHPLTPERKEEFLDYLIKLIDST